MEKIIINKHTGELLTKQAIISLKETFVRLNKVIDLLDLSDKEEKRQELKKSYDIYLKYINKLTAKKYETHK